MRMSCSGCRVLRKGCSDNCTIRPCLQWIKSPDSQANATLFLAKFYGRAGLLNLIESGPEHFRPAIFRSLLYEACGRIVNPIYGSVGLLWSGKWAECQAAVDAVLSGLPITQEPSSPDSVSDAPAPRHSNIPPLKSYDIRHVPKDSTTMLAGDLNKVKTRTRFKRHATRTKAQHGDFSQDWGLVPLRNGDSKEDESMFSVETVEASLVNRIRPDPVFKLANQCDNREVRLELSLGLLPVLSPQICSGEAGELTNDRPTGVNCSREPISSVSASLGQKRCNFGGL